MNVATVKVSQWDARENLRRLRRRMHADAHAAADQNYRNLEKTYIQQAKGCPIIDVALVIPAAGRFPSGLPKLAFARADRSRVLCNAYGDGRVRFDWSGRGWPRAGETLETRFTDRIAAPGSATAIAGSAIVPLVPIDKKPRGQLSNFHILWEADWKAAPVDPYLLRHIAGTLYAVVAEWDLTATERAVLGATK